MASIYDKDTVDTVTSAVRAFNQMVLDFQNGFLTSSPKAHQEGFPETMTPAGPSLFFQVRRA